MVYGRVGMVYGVEGGSGNGVGSWWMVMVYGRVGMVCGVEGGVRQWNLVCGDSVNKGLVHTFLSHTERKGRGAKATHTTTTGVGGEIVRRFLGGRHTVASAWHRLEGC
jgi:hypothetical protein